MISVRRTLFLALPCWAALAFPGLALATTVAPAATSVELSPVSTLLQTVLAMAVVLGVILGLAWLARRVNPMALTGNPASLRVVSGVMVGQRERVVVVEVQGKWLVLGVAHSRSTYCVHWTSQRMSQLMCQWHAGHLPTSCALF